MRIGRREKRGAVWKFVDCGVGLSIFLSACALTPLKQEPSTPPSPAFVHWSQSGEPTKRICVLPFADRTNTEGLASLVRESFSGHLSVKRFVDVELREIDTQLAQVGGGWERYSPQQLGPVLQCDAVVYGEVTDAKRFYLGMYAQLTLAGDIRVVDTRSGQSLVTESH